MTQKVDKKQQEEKSDGKGGIRFGTGVAYDDAYAGGSHNGEEEYVTALPTLDEERKLMSDDYDNVRGRELEELDDAGQAPSGGGRRSSTWKVSCWALVLFSFSYSMEFNKCLTFFSNNFISYVTDNRR